MGADFFALGEGVGKFEFRIYDKEGKYLKTETIELLLTAGDKIYLDYDGVIES